MSCTVCTHTAYNNMDTFTMDTFNMDTMYGRPYLHVWWGCTPCKADCTYMARLPSISPLSPLALLSTCAAQPRQASTSSRATARATGCEDRCRRPPWRSPRPSCSARPPSVTPHPCQPPRRSRASRGPTARQAGARSRSTPARSRRAPNLRFPPRTWP